LSGFRALKSMAMRCRMLLICNLLKHIFVNHKHANYICPSKAKQINNYFTTHFRYGYHRN
jgi:hypothetical protein